MQNKPIVGYCHYYLHKGYLTVNLMKDHDCLHKECKFFERFQEYPYWVEQERLRNEKVKEKLTKKIHSISEEARYEILRAAAQEIADELGYPIIITRVVRTIDQGKRKHVINYVSDCPYNDWFEYFELLERMRLRFGGAYMLLQMKLLNGAYAVISDWLTRKKKTKAAIDIFKNYTGIKAVNNFEQIVKFLISKYSPLGLIVYGSFADGSVEKGSDFDAVFDHCYRRGMP